MHFFFIRVKDQFVGTLEDKLKSFPEVLRVEQVSVLGMPAKCEHGFRLPISREHTMLIIRSRRRENVEAVLDAAKTFEMVLHCEVVTMAEESV